MPQTFLFVDYENVGKVDLSAIPAEVIVPFFFGASQKSVPTEFMKTALKLGARFLPIDIEGHGANALDFHIAFYLGEFMTRDNSAHCIILSKDKGFDPLIKHLRGRGLHARRAASMAEAFPTKPPAPGAADAPGKDTSGKAAKPYDSAIQWLRAMSARARPRKRKGLVAHLCNHFGRNIAEADVQRLVDQMIAEKKLSETNGALAYHL